MSGETQLNSGRYPRALVVRGFFYVPKQKRQHQPTSPEQWNDERWTGFTKIIDFLKTKNVVFMTPSEYLKQVQPKP